MSDNVLDRPARLSRLRHTPLRDLLRGRLTGRLDWRRMIAGAAIDPQAKALTQHVVRQSRLWRSERVDVARELLAHFADAAAVGVPVEKAVADFGDAAAAARLIRRAKIRNRPYVWHAWKWLCRGVAAIALFYAGLTIYFLTGRPSPVVDYVAQLNQPILATPIDQRAWPIYRDVLIENGDLTVYPNAWASEDPKDFQTAAAWLEAHPSAVERIRQAAAKPELGFVLGAGGSADELAVLLKGLEKSTIVQDTSTLDGSLLFVLLPHLNHMRALAYVLTTDAEVARRSNDAARVQKNLVALLGLSGQVTDNEPFIISQIVAIGLHALTYKEISRTLDTTPTLLSDDELRDLSRRLDGPRLASDWVSFAGERMGFHDVIQRTYTDDGNGDGRFTFEGMRAVHWITNTTRSVQNDISPGLTIASPAMMLVSASRRELLKRYDELLDTYEAALHRPLRELDRPPAEAEIAAFRSSTFDQLRYNILLAMMPLFDRVQIAAERALATRDGVQIGIALELYRRQHGAWPAALNDLSPAFLPSVPVDPITGGAMGYRIFEGKPIIYSVGADRDDDAGRSPLRDEEPAPFLAANWFDIPANGEGDWVLYPVVPPRVP